MSISTGLEDERWCNKVEIERLIAPYSVILNNPNKTSLYFNREACIYSATVRVGAESKIGKRKGFRVIKLQLLIKTKIGIGYLSYITIIKELSGNKRSK